MTLTEKREVAVRILIGSNVSMINMDVCSRVMAVIYKYVSK